MVFMILVSKPADLASANMSFTSEAMLVFSSSKRSILSINERSLSAAIPPTSFFSSVIIISLIKICFADENSKNNLGLQDLNNIFLTYIHYITINKNLFLLKEIIMPIGTRTKILATLGPSSETSEKIEKLVEAGADAFRFNFSHGTHAEHKERFDIVRKLEKKFKRYITVVADLQGPKLRIGEFATGEIFLKEGDKFTLDMDSKLGDAHRVCLPHKEIFQAVEKDHTLLLNDGSVALTIKSVDAKKGIMETVVKYGGRLSSRKGVNVPNVQLPISAITDKDKEDLKFALKMGVDYVSLSFVQRADDVREARKIIGDKAWIISKLEKPSAIDQLDEIIQLSDAIMVARGDLGVECPIQDVPVLQKKIVSACRKHARPVIVATQMLESMISSPSPTRAEVSDVATDRKSTRLNSSH